MDIEAFFLVNATQAAIILDLTKGYPNQVEPTLVRGGVHAGKYAIPYRCLYDETLAYMRPTFAVLTPVSLEKSAAFPQPSEE